MKRFLLTSAMLVVLIPLAPANATDVSDPTPVQAMAPLSVYRWTGLYGGVNGFGIGKCRHLVVGARSWLSHRRRRRRQREQPGARQHEWIHWRRTVRVQLSNPIDLAGCRGGPGIYGDLGL